MSPARIVRVSGALVEAVPLEGASLFELARVGERRLLAEVIRVAGERATLQVYEDTAGLRLGEPVDLGGHGLTAHLGPGLLGSVLDGIGRSLAATAARTGDYIHPGITAETLDPERRFEFVPGARTGERLTGGDVLGHVEEQPGFVHPILVPPGLEGTLDSIRPGNFTVGEMVGSLDDGTKLRLAHDWPVRRPRPFQRRLAFDRPFLTGQRVFDFLFPAAEGGTVAVPGGFGTGKTVIEQSLAKYAEADVVVFIGCGERGNEMAELLSDFPDLVDDRSGRSLMERTVLIVNTSNMPVAAREASVYLGITIAEYYRDQGRRVAVVADSLSRWAEALREIAARLQEMPSEEGMPTYLGNRLGKLYERAGRVEALGRPQRVGSLTFVGAVSPPGGDFSEPVTQASLRVAGGLWALDPTLAHQRHFPAVDLEASYSLYAAGLMEWFANATHDDWPSVRSESLRLLQLERDVREIAGLVGPEALQEGDRFILEIGRIVREIVLSQSAFSEHDAASPLEKTYRLATLAHRAYRAGLASLERGRAPDPAALEGVGRMLASVRDAPFEDLDARVADAEAALERMGGGS